MRTAALLRFDLWGFLRFLRGPLRRAPSAVDGISFDEPGQDGAEDQEAGEVDAGGPDGHDPAQGLQAVMAGDHEEAEGGGGDDGAKEQGAVGDVPGAPGALGIVEGFAVSMDEEDAIFVARADQYREAEKVCEIP